MDDLQKARFEFIYEGIFIRKVHLFDLLEEWNNLSDEERQEFIIKFYNKQI